MLIFTVLENLEISSKHKFVWIRYNLKHNIDMNFLETHTDVLFICINLLFHIKKHISLFRRVIIGGELT